MIVVERLGKAWLLIALALGTAAFALRDLALDTVSWSGAQWRAPNPRQTGPYPSAIAVTTAGVVLVAMAR